MIEFLENNYFIPLYAIALIASIIRYKWYYDTVLKYFPILICFALLAEILGYLIRDFDGFQIIYLENIGHYYNHVIFNIFDIVFFTYFFYVFFKTFSKEKEKQYIVYGGIFFLISSLINPFFQNILLHPQTYAIYAGSLVIILCALSYLKQIKKQNSDIKTRYNILLFWICIGFLVFYPLYPIIMTISDYQGLYQKLHTQQVLHTIIIGMYTCFTIGFIRMPKGRFMK